MNTSKNFKIAMVLKTDGLQYDERVRKEVLTIQRLYPNISFKIFPMLPNNEQVEGVTDYGVPYKSIYCKTRDKYPSKSHLLSKALDFYRVAQRETRGFDAVWCADPEAFAVAALIRTPHLIWDLHEIPGALTGKRIRKLLLRYIFYRCDVVIHANPQRIKYIESIGCIKNHDKHFAIRNYPQNENVKDNYNEKWKEFLSWKRDRNCVYLQGLTGEARSDYETVSAVLRIQDLIAVVVGNFKQETKDKLIDNYGEGIIKERVFFLGKVPQKDIPQYIKQCFFSLVFYKSLKINWEYCEPNRFYQSVVLGLPVVVGNNPPMREVIEKYHFGVSVNDDGGNIEEIVKGVNSLLQNYNYYKENIQKYKDNLLWETQDSVFAKIIEILFR